MAKKPTRKNIIKKLDTIFSIYIRRRFAKNEIAECFTCNKIAHYKTGGMQCGHFHSRKHLSTRFDEINCQVQCSACNVFRYGEQYIFSLNLDAHYGEGTAESKSVLAKHSIKISRAEYLTKISYYKNIVKNLKKEKNLD